MVYLPKVHLVEFLKATVGKYTIHPSIHWPYVFEMGVPKQLELQVKRSGV